MNFYTEPQKNIPITANVDVLVAGAGPAGFAAALTAARGGAKTMLIEYYGAIGGMATSGLMSHWTGSSASKVYLELLTKCSQENESLNGDYGIKDKITKYIDPEKLKGVMLDMLLDAGVIVRFYTFASDVIMDGNDLKGVIIESKSGREAILAKVVIDSTGDGDVAAKTGAEYIKGREEDGKMQPTTIMFKVGGVDYERAAFLYSFETTYETDKGELQSMAKNYISAPAGHVLLYPSTLPGIVTCNMTNAIDIDGTKSESLTEAEIICRRQMKEIVAYLREFVPGYENCFILDSAAMMGVRETRHFKGLYTLTQEDILEAKTFDDTISEECKFNFDVHNITGSGLDKTGVQEKFTQKNGYDIPYGCLVPEKIDNLLLSGRNISGTHIAHSNYRAMPICIGTGAGAGAAAAIAVKNNIKVRDANPKDIQKALGIER